MADGTRSGLWHHVVRAIDALNPCLVVIENVRGLLSSSAGSPGDVEPCPWCLGDGTGQPAVRALGAVLGFLANLRFDARWCVLRASDVGAPHHRAQVFLAAWPSERTAAAQDADEQPGDQRRQPAPGETQGGRSRPEPGGRSRVAPAHLSSPALTPARCTGHAHGAGTEGPRRRGIADGGAVAVLGSGGRGVRSGVWGPYGAAIARWEKITRRAPRPTDDAGRLSPQFVEWMQGLDHGWVTATPGLGRPAQLAALGNGVVPQQAARALQILAPPRPPCRHHTLL
ncbi:DNA cytosine methyltransferase [Streptomyces sp. WAC01526]|uniref:DNA cytosine methyltransferase n=1 Tax=Streptomyces sp. WAC01526 TaxID=2588709 RepID=UPI0021CC5AD2|nr:DNA cytosine methyltransferase [Streptomyces sp. WAC01526]